MKSTSDKRPYVFSFGTRRDLDIGTIRQNVALSKLCNIYYSGRIMQRKLVERTPSYRIGFLVRARSYRVSSDIIKVLVRALRPS